MSIATKKIILYFFVSLLRVCTGANILFQAVTGSERWYLAIARYPHLPGGDVFAIAAFSGFHLKGSETSELYLLPANQRVSDDLEHFVHHIIGLILVVAFLAQRGHDIGLTQCPTP